MATFSEALKNLVNSFAGVTALIGALPTMRYYPVRLPQTPQPPIYPAITYQRIDDLPIQSHDGFAGVIDARVQFTIWSTTYASGEAIEKALRAIPPLGLEGYKGIVSGVSFDRIFTVGGITDFEPVTQVHQRTMDLLIGYIA